MRRLVMAYLVFEAVLLSTFWVWLTTTPVAAGYFAAAGSSSILAVFRFADLAVLAASAVGCAAALVVKPAIARVLAWLHAGAAVYAGVCAWGGWRDGILTLAAMISMAPLVAGAVVVAMVVERRERRA